MSPQVHLPPYTPIVVHALVIGLGQKWLRTLVSKTNFLPPNEVRQHAPIAQVFFPLLGELSGCWIFVVPKVFSQSSRCIPKVPIMFPNMFPNSFLTLPHILGTIIYLFIYLH
jgi:hypothetical protein